MTGPAPAAPDGKPPRPWWVPLLGVGSIGLGGFQALGGLMLAWVATLVGGKAGGTFFGLCLAWLLPGLVLATSGAGVVTGARWGRALSLAAVAAGALALGLVAWNRAAIPAAVADFYEYVEREHGSSRDVADLLKRMQAAGQGDPVAVLRDPDTARVSAWTFTVECCCPVVPWYLVVLLACALPGGRRIAGP